MTATLGPALSALLACALVGAGACKEERKLQLPSSASSSGPRKVRVGRVEVKMDRDRIRATGTAVARSTTKIMPLVPGVIMRLPLKEGDRVRKRQVLAVLDQRSYRLRLRQAEAALEGARVAMSAAEREKKRFEQLLKVDATARAQYEQVRDKYRGAQAQLKAAAVGLAMARKALSDTTLRSPYDGIVYKKMASIGDYATSMPPTVLMVLMQVSTLELKVSLPEPELQRVAPGAAARIHFPSIDREVKASVSRVLGAVDPLSRSFEVVIELDNDDLKLKPGLYATVSIATSKPRRRLLVPNEALVDEGSGVYAVFVLQGDRARRRRVRAAAAGRGKTEIISGVDGSEQLILDAAGLLDGDVVRPAGTARAGDRPARKEGRLEAKR